MGIHRDFVATPHLLQDNNFVHKHKLVDPPSMFAEVPHTGERSKEPASKRETFVECMNNDKPRPSRWEDEIKAVIRMECWASAGAYGISRLNGYHGALTGEEKEGLDWCARQAEQLGKGPKICTVTETYKDDDFWLLCGDDYEDKIGLDYWNKIADLLNSKSARIDKGRKTSKRDFGFTGDRCSQEASEKNGYIPVPNTHKGTPCDYSPKREDVVPWIAELMALLSDEVMDKFGEAPFCTRMHGNWFRNELGAKKIHPRNRFDSIRFNKGLATSPLHTHLDVGNDPDVEYSQNFVFFRYMIEDGVLYRLSIVLYNKDSVNQYAKKYQVVSTIAANVIRHHDDHLDKERTQIGSWLLLDEEAEGVTHKKVPIRASRCVGNMGLLATAVTDIFQTYPNMDCSSNMASALMVAGPISECPDGFWYSAKELIKNPFYLKPFLEKHNTKIKEAMKERGLKPTEGHHIEKLHPVEAGIAFSAAVYSQCIQKGDMAKWGGDPTAELHPPNEAPLPFALNLRMGIPHESHQRMRNYMTDAVWTPEKFLRGYSAVVAASYNCHKDPEQGLYTKNNLHAKHEFLTNYFAREVHGAGPLTAQMLISALALIKVLPVAFAAHAKISETSLVGVYLKKHGGFPQDAQKFAGHARILVECVAKQLNSTLAVAEEVICLYVKHQKGQADKYCEPIFPGGWAYYFQGQDLWRYGGTPKCPLHKEAPDILDWNIDYQKHGLCGVKIDSTISFWSQKVGGRTTHVKNKLPKPKVDLVSMFSLRRKRVNFHDPAAVATALALPSEIQIRFARHFGNVVRDATRYPILSNEVKAAIGLPGCKDDKVYHRDNKLVDNEWPFLNRSEKKITLKAYCLKNGSRFHYVPHTFPLYEDKVYQDKVPINVATKVINNIRYFSDDKAAKQYTDFYFLLTHQMTALKACSESMEEFILVSGREDFLPGKGGLKSRKHQEKSYNTHTPASVSRQNRKLKKLADGHRIDSPKMTTKERRAAQKIVETSKQSFQLSGGKRKFDEALLDCDKLTAVRSDNLKHIEAAVVLRKEKTRVNKQSEGETCMPYAVGVRYKGGGRVFYLVDSNGHRVSGIFFSYEWTHRCNSGPSLEQVVSDSGSALVKFEYLKILDHRPPTGKEKAFYSSKKVSCTFMLEIMWATGETSHVPKGYLEMDSPKELADYARRKGLDQTEGWIKLCANYP